MAWSYGSVTVDGGRRNEFDVAFASELFSLIDEIPQVCHPKKSVLFCIDGPAPLVKLMAQRKRRDEDRTAATSNIAKVWSEKNKQGIDSL